MKYPRMMLRGVDMFVFRKNGGSLLELLELLGLLPMASGAHNITFEGVSM